MNDPYLEYLADKLESAKPKGFKPSELHPIHFGWQRLGIEWALQMGRSALFWERGLGKTLAQVEFASQVQQQTKGRVLIVCPLAVASQTIREAQKLSIDVEQVRSMDDVRLADSPITIINFDMFRKFSMDDAKFLSGLVIDESSILKSYTGRTKQFILDFVKKINYRLFCTATPSPNDYMELGNHAEGLGVMPSQQMLSNWFQTKRGLQFGGEMTAGKYDIRPYAEKDFWRWVTTWANIVSTPSDLGFSDEGYTRPALEIRRHLLGVDHRRAHDRMNGKGQRYLMLGDSLSATELWGEKKETAGERVQKAIEIVKSEPDEYHIIWCDMNEEATLLYKALKADDVVEVRGSDKIEDKEAKLDSFSNGSSRVIITKSKIAGMGLNWQHCARQTFVSINYKWEEWYQAVGRTDRFGNERQTIVNMIMTETEQRIIKTLERKGKQHQKMHRKVQEIINEFGLWRTDTRQLNVNLGDQEMRLPEWL